MKTAMLSNQTGLLTKGKLMFTEFEDEENRGESLFCTRRIVRMRKRLRILQAFPQNISLVIAL
jgi:hypothetical protein